MIIFLYGPDSYRRNKKIKELTEAYKQKHKEIDLLRIDLEENPDDWTRARDFLNQPSMFVETKVLVIEESGEAEEKEWIKTISKEKETPKNFIFISDSGKPKKAFGFLTKEPVKFQEFEELSGESLRSFLKKEAEKRKLVFSDEAFKFLMAFFSESEGRSARVINELDKISLLKKPAPGLSDIRGLMDLKNREVAFSLARRFIFSRSEKERLYLLENFLLGGESAAYFFNSLAYQSQGKSAVELADYDIAVKSGLLEYEEALLSLAVGGRT